MIAGNIIFAATQGAFVPKQIEMFTGGKWSHSLVGLPEYLGRPMGIEAVEGGVSICDFNDAYRNNSAQKFERYEFLVDDATIIRACHATLDLLELSYPFLSYLWFMWRGMLKKLFGIDIKQKDNWFPYHFVCSGVCRYFLEQAGYSALTTGYGHGSFTAQDLYEIVLSRPDLFNLVEKK